MPRCAKSMTVLLPLVAVALLFGSRESSAQTPPTVTASIPVGMHPYSAAVNPKTNRIYIATRNSVSVVDGATQGVVATIALADDPSGVINSIGVNAATNRIYVSVGGRFVSVIDGVTDAVVATVLVDCAGGVAVNPATNRIYVSNYCSDAVSVVDGVTDSVTGAIPVGAYPLAIDVNVTTNQIYVANGRDGTVSVIDGSTNSVSATVDVGAGPAGLAVNPTTNRVYVTHYPDYRYFSVVDGATNTVGTVPLSGPVIGIGVSPVTGRIYLASYLNDSVTVLDGETYAVVATTPLAAGSVPWAVAVNPVTGLVYVTQMWDQGPASDTVSVIADPQASTSSDDLNDVTSQGNATDNAAGVKKSLSSKLNAAVAAFPIVIDATALSTRLVTISVVNTVFPASQTFPVQLVPGVYLLSDDGGGRASFIVTETGTVDFDPALNGILQGRGAATLVVKGAAIQIDATALTTRAVDLNFIAEFPTAAIFAARLLPGTYRLVAVGAVSFAVTPAGPGAVDFDQALDGILQGRGTGTLVVKGAAIRIDATALTTRAVDLNFIAEFPTAATFPVRLLPGTYRLVAVGAVSFAVTATPGTGAVDFDQALDGILQGRGTDTLVVKGATIRIDATELTTRAVDLNFIAEFPTAAIFPARLLPGTYRLVAVGAVSFTVTPAGTGAVDFDQTLDGILQGRGTATLVVKGAAIQIDATALSGQEVDLNHIAAFPNAAVFSARLLPGTYRLTFLNGIRAVALLVTVSDTQTVNYDSSFDSIVSGRGTNRLVIGPDTTPPTATLTVTPTSLWPPNHQLVTITPTLAASDLGGPATISGPIVTSNEPVDGLGDGDTSPDWIITGLYGIQLRAERSATGNGRTYTITYVVRNPSGNTATVSARVVVPKSQGK